MFSSTAKLQRQKLGRLGENAAVRLLHSRGMDVLVRNFRCKSGELDIVAADGRKLHFVEVKTITARPGFSPAGNLSPRQRKRNLNAARFYCSLLDVAGYEVCFDLVEVLFTSGRITALCFTGDYLPPFVVQ